MTRLFISDLPVSSDTWNLSEENSRIVRDVLRSRVGDTIELLDGKGAVMTAKVSAIQKKECRVEVVDRKTAARPQLTMVLLQALPKGDKSTLIIQKAVEWGVKQIIFVASDYAVAKKSEHRIDRWQRVAIEALRQSGNPFLPDIEGPMSLPLAIEKSFTECSILFDETEQHTMLKSVLPPTLKSVRFAIGPEGGWSDDERKIFRAADFKSSKLAPYVLRTETAGVSAMGAIYSLAGS